MSKSTWKSFVPPTIDCKTTFYYYSTKMITATTLFFTFKIRRVAHKNNTGINHPFANIKIFVKIFTNFFIFNLSCCGPNLIVFKKRVRNLSHFTTYSNPELRLIPARTAESKTASAVKWAMRPNIWFIIIKNNKKVVIWVFACGGEAGISSLYIISSYHVTVIIMNDHFFLVFWQLQNV